MQFSMCIHSFMNWACTDRCPPFVCVCMHILDMLRCEREHAPWLVVVYTVIYIYIHIYIYIYIYIQIYVCIE
jgi:hypothetical protein